MKYKVINKNYIIYDEIKIASEQDILDIVAICLKIE